MSAASTSLQMAQYFTVTPMALAIYDYCLTIAPEVQCELRWTVIRVTFTLARYVPFIGVAMTTYAAVADRCKFKSCSTYNSVSNG
ncbi:hypothetical protein M405DRAFT_813287, partial [Rhizopogon salebrosus TDB-379]